MDNIGSNTSYPTQSFGGGGGSAGFSQPYKLGSGVMRGTQIIANSDGSKMTLGNIPNTTDFGIAFYDKLGNMISTITGTTYSFYENNVLIQKITDGTTYIYDPNNGNVNIMQIGKLPDGTYGWAIAATGKNVADGIS